MDTQRLPALQALIAEARYPLLKQARRWIDLTTAPEIELADEPLDGNTPIAPDQSPRLLCIPLTSPIINHVFLFDDGSAVYPSITQQPTLADAARFIGKPPALVIELVFDCWTVYPGLTPD